MLEISGCDMGFNCIQGCLDVPMMTSVFASKPSEFSGVETKVDNGCTCHFDVVQVNSLLLLVIIPGLAKQREIYFQPSYDFGDHLCKGLAYKTEVMKVLHSKFLLESLEKGCNYAMELQGINLIVLVLGWSHANI
jgi:hypothetical protein